MEVFPASYSAGVGASPSGCGRLFARRSREGNGSSKRSREKGAGNLKAIVWTVILVAFIYVAAMVVPVLINEYQFQDGIQSIARFATVSRKSNDQVKKEVLAEAQKEDLPVELDDIKVQMNGGNVHINVDYSVTVDLKVYQWTLNFHPEASNAAIL